MFHYSEFFLVTPSVVVHSLHVEELFVNQRIYILFVLKLSHKLLENGAETELKVTALHYLLRQWIILNLPSDGRY